ncbi:Dolichyl-diphosphooligosaccharide--protein glycosyltransferase subunit DAD1 [Cardamine amara subsp. amara]|uniref:Dolichyl-diphosphooligosaccharide--protein glycosyltransferase subunit DAD1 n=1 Tax=Cardamine amara subsp. amara TaxID=228776 RepID=A0ABD1BMY7_CARAN
MSNKIYFLILYVLNLIFTRVGKGENERNESDERKKEILIKIIDLYVVFAVFTALIQVAYMALVGSFPFNSFLSGVLSCIGTAVLAVCLRIQVNKENKEFKDLAPERAFADFVLCNLVLPLGDHQLPRIGFTLLFTGCYYVFMFWSF